jgi:hypothetical protein
MSARVSGNAASGPFARIASLALGAKKKAEEDEDMKKDDGECAEEKDEGETDDDEKGSKKGKKAKADEEDGDGEDDEEASEKDDEDEKASEDDEDEKDDKKGKKAARRAERQRIASIITSPAAQRSQAHLENAMYLAFNTDMNAKEAVGMLMCMSAPKEEKASSDRSDARKRLDSTPNPSVADESQASGGPNLAAQIIAAGKKRRGESDK